MASDSTHTNHPRSHIRELRRLHERAISKGPAFGLSQGCTETRDSTSWAIDGIAGWRVVASTLKWEYKIRWLDCIMDTNDLGTYLSSTVDGMPLALSVEAVKYDQQVARICWKDTWLPGDDLGCNLAISAFWSLFDKDLREGLELPMADTVVLLQGKKRTWQSERQQLCDEMGEVLQANAQMSLELLW